MFSMPEEYRYDNLYWDNINLFIIPYPHPLSKKILLCLADDETDYETVSVSIKNHCEMPTFEMINFVRNIFWEPDDIVIQEKLPYCLHLWRSKKRTLRTNLKKINDI